MGWVYDSTKTEFILVSGKMVRTRIREHSTGRMGPNLKEISSPIVYTGKVFCISPTRLVKKGFMRVCGKMKTGKSKLYCYRTGI